MANVYNPNLSGLNLPQPLVDAIRLVFQSLSELRNQADGSLAPLGTEPLIIDIGVNPAVEQLKLMAGALGSLGLFCYGTDNAQALFDCYWVGGVVNKMYATNATCARIVKNLGYLIFYVASGQTVVTSVGTTGTGWVSAARLDLTSGDWGFGGNTAPGEAVDATGNINASVSR